MPSYLSEFLPADAEGKKSLNEREVSPEGPVPAEAQLTKVSLQTLSPPALIMASDITGMNITTPVTLANILSNPEHLSQDLRRGYGERTNTEVPRLCALTRAGFSADDQD